MKLQTRLPILPAILCAAVLPGCDASAPAESATSAPAAAAQSPGPSPSGAAQALADALSDPDPYSRARNLGTLLPTLGPDSIPAVRETLERFRLDLGAAEFELLVRFWASHAPAEATAWIFKKSPPAFREAGARTAIEVWAAAEPAGALVAVESALRESDVDVAREVRLALVRGWFQADREGLERYIYGLGSGLDRQRSLFAFVLALTAAQGSEAAVRWAESVPEDDPRYKLSVYRQLMSALSWADMPAAMRFCETHCDGPFAKGLRNVLIRTRLRDGDEGGEVVEWVATAPEESDRQRADKWHSLWVAYATWAYRDRDGAVAWMQGKLADGEPEPWLPMLYGEYARQIAQDSPVEAIRWAERIQDDVDRERSLVRIARFWVTQDPEAAEAWLSQSALSEHARQKARNVQKPSYLPKVPEVPKGEQAAEQP